MTIYCGVDFHARVQTVCYCDLSDGEVHVIELSHQVRDEVREFYATLGGEVIVGLEATGYSRWFEQLLEELGHQVWIGDATEIRRLAKRRQKTDARFQKGLGSFPAPLPQSARRPGGCGKRKEEKETILKLAT